VSDGTRTHDRLDHNQELYQLSYAHRGPSNLASRRIGFAQDRRRDEPSPAGVLLTAPHGCPVEPNIAVLWACFRAFGVNPSIPAVVMGYQVGYLANLVPVPGSIGALEGGLTGALLLYGTPPGRTVAAVITYHAIALWLPTIGGTIAFGVLRGTLHKTLPNAVLARIRGAAERGGSSHSFRCALRTRTRRCSCRARSWCRRGGIRLRESAARLHGGR
jgi:Lysylphosphatidylglycerol synthase TM region